MATVRLEFSQFGDFDSFDIFRSTGVLDPEALPTPIVTGLTTMFYIDTTPAEGTNHYMVRVNRGAESVLSDDFSVGVSTFTAPYNLAAVYTSDPTPVLSLNWGVDGFIDEQRYYCSTSPIDINNLPVPKVVLANDVRMYLDTDIIEGQAYYVCIGSVKNGIEKMSAEVEVVASLGVLFQYFRVYITENNGNSITSLQELELASTVGGSDITNPSMLTGQSSFFVGAEANDAAKLIDNDFTNYFDKVWVTVSGSVFPQWAWVNLGAIQEVVEIRLYPQNYSEGSTRSPKNFVIQGSNDGLSWTDIKSFSNVTGWVAGTPKTFNLITGAVT